MGNNVHMSLLVKGWTQLNPTSKLLEHLLVWIQVMLPLWMLFTQMDCLLTRTWVHVIVGTKIKEQWI